MINYKDKRIVSYQTVEQAENDTYIYIMFIYHPDLTVHRPTILTGIFIHSVMTEEKACFGTFLCCSS